MMEPDKRGNPPFEPSSYAAGLERRVKRHHGWSRTARKMAGYLLDGVESQRSVAEVWWREQLNQPEVVLSGDEMTIPGDIGRLDIV